MRIAFIVNNFPCLSETFVLNQITGLLDRGHEVDIFANSPRNDPMVHADIERHNLLDRTFYGAAYLRMPANKFLRLVKAVCLIIANFHKKPMLLLNTLKFGKGAVPLSSLYKTIKFLKYDIVHCHFGPNGKRFLFLKDILGSKVKYITVFHAYDITKVLKQNGGNFYDSLFKKGDLFLPISNHWKKRLIELGCNKDKIIVHRMGIDTDRFQFKIRKLQCDQKIRLLTVARLVEKKGVKYAVRATAKVARKHPDLEYKIAGDGPLRNDLESLIAHLGVQDKIKLLGWLDHSEVQSLMQEADIFILPSVTSQNGDQEGIPVVLMEAQAVGLPVISTWHSGIPELVVNEKTGFLVPEGDVDALADKLKYLIEHPERWPEMGQAGRRYVEENFDINKLNNQLLEIYQQLLN